MKKEDLFNDEFLKQFKTGEELTGFLKQLQKRGIEKMLEGELDGHLGYSKHEQTINNNARNGFTKKKVKTSFGESEIAVPRDREASFNPILVPKRKSMVDDIEFDIEDNLTVVPGVIDSDTGLGYKQISNDSWESVNVSDDYAENNFTLIVEPNNFDSCGNTTFLSAQISEDFSDALQNYQPCFVADGGNGGSNVVVNNFSDQMQKYYSRKDIRKERSKWIGALWDPNWECSEPIHEQLFVVYEDDNTSPIDLDFSGIKWGDETYGAVDLEYEVRTKDEIIRIIERESTEFFLTNLLDQGCDCKDGLNSFSDRCWVWYDCGTNFKYTMPHRWVQIN